MHGSLLPEFNILYLALLHFISLKTTLHSCSSLWFLFTQVGVILTSDVHVLYSIISAAKHNFETANDSDPYTATLQCPWRVTENLWLTLVKRTPSRCHTPTFNDCICGVFVYCSYKNLTKTRMNHINPLKSQGWLFCQRKEVGCFSGMHYLQVCVGCFYSLLPSTSMLSVDRSWTDGYVILWVPFFLLFKGKFVIFPLAVLFIRGLEYISCRNSFFSFLFLYHHLGWKLVIQWLQLTPFMTINHTVPLHFCIN